jgi:hypothetical protein
MSEIQYLRKINQILQDALEGYAQCCDRCTCGDGWSHNGAIEALKRAKEIENAAKISRQLAD